MNMYANSTKVFLVGAFATALTACGGTEATLVEKSSLRSVSPVPPVCEVLDTQGQMAPFAQGDETTVFARVELIGSEVWLALKEPILVDGGRAGQGCIERLAVVDPPSALEDGMELMVDVEVKAVQPARDDRGIEVVWIEVL